MQVFDQYQSIYPKSFVAIAEQALPRMTDGQGKIVVISNPGCNHMQAAYCHIPSRSHAAPTVLAPDATRSLRARLSPPPCPHPPYPDASRRLRYARDG